MIATNPSENPLLYKFNPEYICPVHITTDVCNNPANRPAIGPNCPAIGAIPALKSAASCMAGMVCILRILFPV